MLSVLTSLSVSLIRMLDTETKIFYDRPQKAFIKGPFINKGMKSIGLRLSIKIDPSLYPYLLTVELQWLEHLWSYEKNV